MNIKLKILLCVILVSMTFSQAFAQTDENRIVTTLHQGWKFQLGDEALAYQNNFDDSSWSDVTVPHDWAIGQDFIEDGNGNTGKLPWQGQGWYRNNLSVPESYQGKRVYLLFDGVMAFPKVYLNGESVGEWDYGYNSFYLDITDKLQAGDENILAVHVDTREHDSRWYPGAGIYRKVQMIAVDPVHVGIWGTYITTPIVKSNYADLRIRTTVQNKTDSAQAVQVRQVIVNAKGSVVLSGESEGLIQAGGESDLETNLVLTNPRRWDIDDPYLYTTQTSIYVDGQEVDRYLTDFGVRTIRFTADHGFYLNDKRVQLKGVNLHHDHGPLGAAFYPRAMKRQLEIMQAMGVNAIRTSHNTAAPELLALADKMGLLVFDEVFDKYDGKADIIENTDFEEFAQRNIHNFIVRDRNHPSVFLWSVGNEIGDVQWNQNNGFQRLQTMLSYVEKYDPTRPTTLVNDSMDSAELRHFDFYDIHAWNYTRRYRLARQLEPNKSVIISESASTLSTRGFYEFPLPENPSEFTDSLQVSSYDLHYPSWAELADDDFMWQQDEEYIAGEFVWTGFDYLGEPTPYGNFSVRRMGMSNKEASRSSYFGIVDLVGIPKDRYYLYKSYWQQDETTLHILPHWNWQGMEGQNVPVFVYTNGDCAELFLNDRSQGTQCKNPKAEDATERFRLMWKDVEYEAGELKAVAYREGEIIGEQLVRTAGEIAELRLSADHSTITADGMDLSYILVEAFDKDGNPQPLSDDRLNVNITGPGLIRGVGNGNPQSFEPFYSNSFEGAAVDLFYGKAMIIVGSQYEVGTIEVVVSGSGGLGRSISIQSETGI